MKRSLILALAVVVPAASQAALFYDNFDTDTSASWTVNKSATDSSATFAFDYSAYGIPSAPGSAGGSTKGLRMLANQSAGVFQGLSASPTGQSFTGDYLLKAQVWMNFVGAGPAGGSGSTQAGGMGIMTNGTSAQWAGGSQNSVWFATTTDGNSSVDWRAYSPTAGTGYTAASGVFAAGTGTSPDARNNIHPYYSGFGGLGVSAPAAQTLLFPGQTGTVNVGCIAYTWQEMQVLKLGNIVTWKVGGLLIATVDTTGMTLGGDNFHLNYFDTNGTSSTDPNDFLNNAIFDNVSVHAVPEPGTMAVLGLGALALIRRRSSK